MVIPPREQPRRRVSLYSNAVRDLRRIKPNDQPWACGAGVAPGPGATQVGIAYPLGHVGGCGPGHALGNDHLPPEVTWRLVLDREVVDGKAVRLEKAEDLGDRWVLRSGDFVELAKDVV